MAFKVNNPLTYTDPGKKLEVSKKPDPCKANQRGFSSYSIDKDKKTVAFDVVESPISTSTPTNNVNDTSSPPNKMSL